MSRRSISIVSIEHDESFFEETRRKLAKAASRANVDLQHRALKWRLFGGRPFYTYSHVCRRSATWL